MKHHYIGLYFKRIFQIMEKNMNKQLEKIDLTSMQATIIIYIFKSNKTINQRDIEKRFNLSNPTVNGILNRLEKKQFIERITSKTDARNKEIHLTDKSIELNKEMIKRADMMEEKIKKDISKEELKTFYIVMDKILKNIEGDEQ